MSSSYLSSLSSSLSSHKSSETDETVQSIPKDLMIWFPCSSLLWRTNTLKKRSHLPLFLQFIKHISKSSQLPSFFYGSFFNQFPSSMTLEQWLEGQHLDWSRIPAFLTIHNHDDYDHSHQQILLGLEAYQQLKNHLFSQRHTVINQLSSMTIVIAQFWVHFSRIQEWNYLEYVEDAFLEDPILWKAILQLLMLTCQIEHRHYFLMIDPPHLHQWKPFLEKTMVSALFWNPSSFDHTVSAYEFLTLDQVQTLFYSHSLHSSPLEKKYMSHPRQNNLRIYHEDDDSLPL
jgi:hypothetical protein